LRARDERVLPPESGVKEAVKRVWPELSTAEPPPCPEPWRPLAARGRDRDLRHADYADHHAAIMKRSAPISSSHALDSLWSSNTFLLILPGPGKRPREDRVVITNTNSADSHSDLGLVHRLRRTTNSPHNPSRITHLAAAVGVHTTAPATQTLGLPCILPCQRGRLAEQQTQSMQVIVLVQMVSFPCVAFCEERLSLENNDQRTCTELWVSGMHLETSLMTVSDFQTFFLQYS
jgi:hypothetical protein